MREKLGGRRLRFSDAERALLARKVKAVGRKTLMELDPIVSPDTLLRWHRIMRETSELIVLMAHENPSWGIRGFRGLVLTSNIASAVER